MASTDATLPFVTVAICTYNRCDWLERTLRFVTSQDYPSELFEILVVDNRSTDATQQVLAGFATAPKAPRCLIENSQGLSHARNRALREGFGDIIAFLDDDTEGASDWLRQLMQAYMADKSQQIGVVGGEIIPGFPDGCPEWLKGQWEPLAYLEHLGPLPPNRLPMGANFSVRRQLALDQGSFRTDLGRTGDSLAGSEDHDFIRRIRDAGHEIWFAPAARVTHFIPANRLTFGYAMKHAFDSSRSRVIEKADRIGRGDVWLFSRVVVYSFHTALTASLSLLCFLIFRPGWGKRWLTRSSRAAGYLVEAFLRITRLRSSSSGE